MEEWKDIDGYEELYQVSNYGRVKSFDRWVIGKSNSKRFIKGKILKTVGNNGYQHVLLCKNGKWKWFYVHRLVAQAFIPNPYNLPEINHRDECKTNNFYVNLEWCDRVYNLTYGSRIEQISKKVQQYSLNGELIAEYPSTHEVERQLGYNQGSISQCCNGKCKTHKGFIWRYKK